MEADLNPEEKHHYKSNRKRISCTFIDKFSPARHHLVSGEFFFQWEDEGEPPPPPPDSLPVGGRAGD